MASIPTTTTAPPTKQQPPVAPSTTKSLHQLAHEVEFAGLSFSTLKVDDNNRKNVYVNMNNRRFQIQTPWLTSFHGVSLPAPMYADPNKPRYKIRFSLDGYDGSNPEVKDFYDMLQLFDKRLIKAGVDNGMEWFKKKALTHDIIEEAMFTKTVKQSDKYAPTFEAKVPYYDGEWACQFYNSKQEKIVDDVETKVSGRMKVRAIIECCPIWFMAGNKYGCKWKVTQLEYESLQDDRSHFDTYAFDTGIPQTIPISKLSFTDVKVNDKTNVKIVYINHNNGTLNIQTPWMSSYNGVALPPPEYADVNNPRYSLQWLLRGHDGSNEEVHAFTTSMLALEERILEEAKTQSFEWFRKKTVSMDVLKSAMFTSMVRYREDKQTGERLLDTPPTFKATVPFYDQQWNCATYNEHKERITENLDVVAGGRIQARAILQCKGIWFINGSFGCGWKVVQMEHQSQPSQSSIPYAFRTSTAPAIAPLEAIGESNASSTTLSSDDECVDSDFE
jgi:hypothetical protein